MQQLDTQNIKPGFQFKNISLRLTIVLFYGTDKRNLALLVRKNDACPYITVREKNLRLLLSASSFYPRLLGPYAPVIQQGLEDRGVSVRRISSRRFGRSCLISWWGFVRSG